MVDVTTYSDARQNLARLMDRVVKSQEPVIVARRKRGSVVMVALDDWNSQQETLHLLSTRANAKRLLDAIEQAVRGKHARVTTVQDLTRIVGKKAQARGTVKSLGRRGRATSRRKAARVPREAAE